MRPFWLMEYVPLIPTKLLWDVKVNKNIKYETDKWRKGREEGVEEIKKEKYRILPGQRRQGWPQSSH